MSSRAGAPPLGLLALALVAAPALGQERWRCTLDLGGAELPFELELEGGRAIVLNAEERIEVPEVVWTEDQIRLGFPHFDSEITASVDPSGAYLGVWRKQRGGESVAEVPCRLAPSPGWRFEPVNGLAPGPGFVEGRWRVQFESEETPAVGLFEPLDEGGALRGTFLTRTGDYRYLEGEIQADGLRLSCFDGAHAFLFHATWDGADRLSGSFKSGDWWTESWTAVRDPEVTLPDPYSELELRQTTRVSETVALWPDGSETTLAEVWASMNPPPRALLVQVLGTWCPNCYDETEFLKALHARYAGQGLGVVGLCFELTGDVGRDLAQIERYRTTREVPYPLLWAGEANKAGTAEALGLTDRILSYPTTIFVNGLGDIDAIHSGFVGPAAPDQHAVLRAEFEERVERLLAERPRRELPAQRFRTGRTTTEGRPLLELTFDDSGAVRLADGATGETQVATLAGPILRSGPRTLVAKAPPNGAESGSMVFEDLASGLRLRPAEDFDPATLGRRRLSSIDDLRLGAHEGWQRLRLLRASVDLTQATGGQLPSNLLASLVRDPDPATRRVAIAALDAEALALAESDLREALGSADPRQRRLAARALVRLDAPAPETTTALADLAASDPFPSVRRAAGGE